MRAALILPLVLFGSGCFSAPAYHGPVSDHFDGERFVNQVPISKLGFGGVMHWWLTQNKPRWPTSIDEPPGPPPPERVGPGEMRVTLVGHATLLLQMDGVNILTDPIYSDVSGPLSWAGVERVRPPAIRFEDLPPIDIVIVSHNHYDHMDLPTLRRLAEVHAPVILVGLGNDLLLAEAGIAGAVALDWWQSHTVGGVEVAAVPVQHASQRGTSDASRTLWCGFVLSSSKAGRAYFGGDTGYGPHFAQVGERYGPIRLAMLPIGAYEPRKYLAPVHISPREAVKAHRELRAHTSVGMHYDTFPLGFERFGQASSDLRHARRRARLTKTEFRLLQFGHGETVPPVP